MATPRLHHTAYRVSDRNAAAKWLCEFLNYEIDEEFTLFFDDEGKQTARCISLKPSLSFEYIFDSDTEFCYDCRLNFEQMHHFPQKIFISDGPPGTIVGDWVAEHGNAVHHAAYECDDVATTMEDWKSKGAKFTSDKPFETDGLIQAFTEVNPYTGIIYELINKDVKGFRAENVKRLMESTKNMGRGAP